MFKIFLLMLLLPMSVVFGQAPTPNPSRPKDYAEQKLVAIANVNIQNIEILSQEGNTFTINFDIVNEQGVQSGVRYGVELVQQTKEGQFVADRMIYNETLTLPERSSLSRSVVYRAPLVLAGEYALLVSASNMQGFPLGIAFVDDVTLTGATRGVSLMADTCTVLSASGVRASVTAGLQVKPEEQITFNCSVYNADGTTVTVTPRSITRVRNAYGIEVPVSATYESSSIAPGITENFSIAVPSQKKPGMYMTSISLEGAGVSNTISSPYIVQGPSASIANTDLDKTVYSKGDIARAGVVWSSLISNTTATVSIKNRNDQLCAETQSRRLDRETDTPKAFFEFSITRDCAEPKISASLTDFKGQVIDQTEFNFVSVEQAQKRNNILMYSVFTVLILSIGGASWYYKKRKYKK